MNDRFIRIQDREFSFEEVAKALGVKIDPSKETLQVKLCQRVDAGILVANGSSFDKDEYPGIDVQLELPPEKDSIPVMISRTEQPRKEGEDHSVRTYGYSRDDEYFLYFDSDTRSDEEVDKDFHLPSIMVSGGPLHPVEVFSENPDFRYCGIVSSSGHGTQSLADKIKTASARASQAQTSQNGKSKDNEPSL